MITLCMTSLFFGTEVYSVKTVSNIPIKTPAKEAIASTFSANVSTDSCANRIKQEILQKQI